MNIFRTLIHLILILFNQILKPFRRQPQEINKVIIYLKGGIGDFTLLIPVLYSLKVSEKIFDVHLVVSRNLFNIVSSYNDRYVFCNQLRTMGSNIDSIVYRLKTFINEVNCNMKQNYDLFFNAWPSKSLMIEAISLFAITNNRIGIEKKYSRSIYNFPIYSNSKENVVGLNAKVLNHLNIPLIHKSLRIPISESDMYTANQKILRCLGKDLNEIKPFIVLYPHTQINNGSIKHWKSENYIEMINILLKDIVGIRFLIMGSKYDYDFCQEIVSGINATPDVLLLAGNTTVYEDCFISSKCDLYIGIDGGFTHLVNAFNIPSIVLWGPTSEKLYGVQNNYIINISTEMEYLQNGISKDFNKSNQENSTNTISPNLIVSFVKKILIPT